MMDEAKGDGVEFRRFFFIYLGPGVRVSGWNELKNPPNGNNPKTG